MITVAVASLIVCPLGIIGLVVGLRTGALALPNGMQVPVLSPAPDGYLAQQPGTVFFLTFSTPPHDGNVSGALYVAQVVNGHVENQQGPWTGTQGSGQLSILFTSGVTWHAVWHGTTLLVTYQDTNGQLNTAPFVAASTSDYNNAVAALQQSTQ